MSVSSTSESPDLRLAKYLKEFVRLRTTTIRDISKYDNVLWFHEMPQESDCISSAWTNEYDPESPWVDKTAL